MLTFMLSLIPSFSITASAASGGVSAGSEAVITVEEIWGNPGKTVDLDMVISKNPGILGATITVSWDEDLTLVADVSGEAFNHMTYTSPSRYVASGTNFVWFGNEVNEAIDGTILTLTFKVAETAQNNDILPVRVSYTHGDIIDQNDNDVTLSVVDGHIRAITYQPGDVTGDGRVNARDLVRLSQYISDGCKTDSEGYNAEVVEDACDVTGDGRVNARDLIKLSQYISDGSQTNPDGYNAVLKPAKMPECQHTNIQEIPAKAATCTEEGNIEYWYCDECGKYFSDAEGETEITLSDTLIGISDEHTYSDVWSGDEEYHWHSAICGHNDQISDKAPHNMNAENTCTICGYQSNVSVKLSTPVISKIEYDTVYWFPVEYADYYTVRVDDNYECTLRGTSCKLSDVKWNGKSISDYKKVKVTVLANGYGNYIESEKSEENTSYFYVPETSSEDVAKLFKFGIGFGYNLIEDDYLDFNECSSKSVFNIAKLLTIGTYTWRPASDGDVSTYNYSSIDEFISKTKVSVEYRQETGCVLLGSVKMQINADVGFDYKKYAYNNTYVYEYNVTYKDHVITNFSDFSLLQYCLSEDFLRDIRKESNSTLGMTDVELLEYLYNNYGTHAILGITTGGTYRAKYVISTNKKDIAASVKASFDMSTGGGGAIDQIIQKDFGIGIDVSENLRWKDESTEASFTCQTYGGSGGAATSAKDVSAAMLAWGSNFSEDNARSIKFSKNGAVSLSSLIALIDVELSMEFDKYVDQRADESYRDLVKKYNQKTNLPMTVSNESGKNILIIDLSAYQKEGLLSNVTSPYIIDGVLSIYPTMLGKAIDEIKIVGNYADYNDKFIDSLTLQPTAGWNKDLYITIENLGVLSATDKGFIDLSDLSSGVNVNINVDGTCAIKAKNGCNAISILETITFTGSGTLDIYGGDGADATKAGDNGADGGIGIIANNVVVDMTGTLNVYGGNGGKGAAGRDQKIGIDTKNGPPATATTSGGKGGNGGLAIESILINISITSNVKLIGGKGGDGGRGGRIIGVNEPRVGGFADIEGGSYVGQEKLPSGANGGDGGNGGAPANSNIIITISESTVLHLMYGNGGKGGDGGNGGDALWEYAGVRPDTGGDGGNAGKGGNGHVGGDSGIGGNGGSSFSNYATKFLGIHEPHDGETGSGGNGNDGGDCFANIIYENGEKTVEEGTPGSGNRGGYRGASQGTTIGKDPKFGVDKSTIIGKNGVPRSHGYNVIIEQ